MGRLATRFCRPWVFDFVASWVDKIDRSVDAVDLDANRCYGRFCRLQQNPPNRSRFCRQRVRGIWCCHKPSLFEPYIWTIVNEWTVYD